MSKNYRSWKSHPRRRKVPKNWDASFKPTIRNITNLDDATNDSNPLPSDLFIVNLRKTDYIRILKALYLYGEKFGDANWQQWRMEIRTTVLKALTPDLKNHDIVGVKLKLKDWRSIWKYAHKTCHEINTNWLIWFHSFSKTIVTQIKNQ